MALQQIGVNQDGSPMMAEVPDPANVPPPGASPLTVAAYGNLGLQPNEIPASVSDAPINNAPVAVPAPINGGHIVMAQPQNTMPVPQPVTIPRMSSGGGGDLERLANKGLATETAGEEQKTNAEIAQNTAKGELQNKQIAEVDTLAKQQQADHLALQKAINDRMAKLDLMAKDFSNSHVDPNHYWSSMDTPRKILSILALGAGGFAGGYSGRGGNAVADQIDNEVKNDINAQVANIANKKSAIELQNTLLGRNMEILKNTDDAAAATYKQLLEGQVRKIDALMTNTQNPITKANLGVVKGQLLQKAATADNTLRTGVADRTKAYAEAYKANIEGAEAGQKLNQQGNSFAIRQMLTTGTVPGATPQEKYKNGLTLINGLTPEDRKNVVWLPDGSPKLASSEDNAKEATSNIAKTTALHNAVNDLDKLIDQRTTYQASGVSPQFNQDVLNKFSQIKQLLAGDEKLRISDTSLQLLSDSMPDSSIFSGARAGIFGRSIAKHQIEQFRNNLNEALKADLASRGVVRGDSQSNPNDLGIISSVPLKRQ